MPAESSRARSLARGLEIAGDLLLYTVLLSLAWKLAWGVVAAGLWDALGTRVLDWIEPWPVWARMLIGFPALLLVFAPFFALYYLLFADRSLEENWDRLVALRRSVGFDLLRAAIYGYVVLGTLKWIWTAPGNDSVAGFQWRAAFERLASVLF